MKRILFNIIRYLCQSGILGFYYPKEFSIKTCLNWRMYQHERATVKYLKAFLKPANVFVNVGAHIGYYAVYAGKLVGRKGIVYAFEPHPDNYKMLVRNCLHLPQVMATQTAVSDSNGEALLFEHSTSSSSHALSDISESGKSCKVPKVSLDEWAFINKVNKVDMVLIDVEGHELSVLKGMYNIINKNPNIIIIVEYCPSNWIKQKININVLLEEIYKLHFKIVCALGQKKKYILPELTSPKIALHKLYEFLDEEIRQEHKDYINIVIKRF